MSKVVYSYIELFKENIQVVDYLKLKKNSCDKLIIKMAH